MEAMQKNNSSIPSFSSLLLGTGPLIFYTLNITNSGFCFSCAAADLIFEERYQVRHPHLHKVFDNYKVQHSKNEYCHHGERGHTHQPGYEWNENQRIYLKDFYRVCILRPMRICHINHLTLI